jgi:hypothetical protein
MDESVPNTNMMNDTFYSKKKQSAGIMGIEATNTQDYM